MNETAKAILKLRQLEQEANIDNLPDQEKTVREQTITEAGANGATITNVHGGLPPSLALGVFRRDEFRCKRCGGHHDLGLHHKGGQKASRHAWRGKKNSPNNLVVVCKGCHNSVHEEDKEIAQEQGS
jgi:hypothetical protein